MQSCSNEFTPLLPDDETFSLLKAPTITAWSGDQTFPANGRMGISRATSGKYYDLSEYEQADEASFDENLTKYWDKRPAQSDDRGENVSQNEMDYVMAYIRAHMDEATPSNQLSTYFVQNVGSLLPENSLPSGKLFIAGTEIESYSAPEGNRGLCVDVPLTGGVRYNNAKGEKVDFDYKYMKITLPDDPKYGANAGKTAIYLITDFTGDGDFTDWVIKLLPGNMRNGSTGDGEETEEPETPEIPETPETPVPGDGDGDGEEIPSHFNEVEVNLSINDTHDNYDIEDVVSKLSIHVRYPHDVKVTIPVPTRFIAEADDLNIVISHPQLLESYGSEHKATYDINGNIVELTVEYVVENDFTNIVVTTHGINEDVFNYCADNFGDGINFEVWNYFAWNEADAEGNWHRMSDKIDTSVLKEYLDRAWIEFDVCEPQREDCGQVCPDYYINAFGYEAGTAEQKKNDCTVRISDSADKNQRDKYENEVRRGEHLNGTPYNDIYVRKGANSEHSH